MKTRQHVHAFAAQDGYMSRYVPRCYLDVVIAVKGEAVVDALRQHNHVALSAVYPDPLLVKVPDIKVPCMPQL